MDAFDQVTGRNIDRLADVIIGYAGQFILRETIDLHGIKNWSDYFPQSVKAQAAGHRVRADEMRERGRALPGVSKALHAFAGLLIR